MILVFMLLLRESQECIPFLKNKQPPNPLLLHWLLLPCQNDFFSSHVLQHVWDDSCSAWHSDWMVSGEGRAWALFERWDVLKQFIIYWFWVLFLLQGALVKTDEQEVINFLLTTEIIPLCLRIMESGSELSKTVPFFVLIKTLCCSSLTDQTASALQSWLLYCCKCWDKPGWRFYLLKNQTDQDLRLSDWPGISWLLMHLQSSHLVHSALCLSLFFSQRRQELCTVLHFLLSLNFHWVKHLLPAGRLFNSGADLKRALHKGCPLSG